MSRFLAAVFLLVISTASIAQREESTRAKNPPADTSKINRFIREVAVLRDTDPFKASQLCLETIGLARQINYKKGVCRATGILGWIYYRRGDFVKALESSIEAFKISEQIGDRVEMSQSLNNLAVIYYEQQQYEKSLNYLKRALRLARQTGDAPSIARSLNNTANLYLMAWHKPDSVKAYASEALLWNKKTSDDYNGAYSNHLLGEYHQSLKENELALSHFFRSLEMSKHVSNSMNVNTWRQIAMVYRDQGRVKDAIEIVRKNIETAQKYGYREELSGLYHLMGDLYKRDGKLAPAVEYLSRYTTLHDSIYNEQNSMKFAMVHSQFDLDLKQAQIELLTKDTELDKKEISRKQIQLYSSIGGFVAILLIAALLFYGNQRVNESNALLERQKDQLATKNREVEIKSRELEMQADQLAHLNATKDKLFSIIGHDFRSPLNSLKGILSLVENKNLSQEEFASIAASLKSNLESVSTNLENLLHWSLAQLQGIHTNPVRVDIHNLVEEHVVLFHELARAKSIRLQNEIPANLFALADADHTRLVLRNLISNAIKFTVPGGVVNISNQIENSYIKIQIADTGMGMESKQMESLFQKVKQHSTSGTHQEKGVGIGLMLCQEFVENNGGHLTVASELGKGSVFSFTLKAA